jgi:hypothetical protein
VLRLSSLLLVVVPAVVASLTATESRPHLADLKVTTQRVMGPTRDHALVETVYFKGALQRREVTNVWQGSREPGWITVVDCDRHRTLRLNHRAKVYDYTVQASTPPLPSAQTSQVPPDPGPPQPRVTFTIDTVDTGQRRNLGSYVARRVKTRMTRLTNGFRDVSEEDAWYIDVPNSECGMDAEFFPVSSANVEVVRRGPPHRGMAIEGSYRSIPESPISMNTRLELVEFSEAPIDEALFAPPRDYLPALLLPGGGRDFSQQDTVANRAKAYWNLAVDWISYRLRW